MDNVIGRKTPKKIRAVQSLTALLYAMMAAVTRGPKKKGDKPQSTTQEPVQADADDERNDWELAGLTMRNGKLHAIGKSQLLLSL